MKIFAPNFNCFLEEVSRMFLPPSLLYFTINTKTWNVKQDLTGMAVDRTGWQPSFKAGTLRGCSTDVLVGISYFSPAYPQTPTQQTHTILSIECLQLTAPLAFLRLEKGGTTATTCYFPPDVPATTISTVLRSGSPRTRPLLTAVKRTAQRGASVSQARSLPPPAEERATQTLSGSSSASLWSLRILPLNNTCILLYRHRRSQSSSVPALQTRRMGKSQEVLNLAQKYRKNSPTRSFSQLPT